MQSHSIKLASLPLSLCLPLFFPQLFSPFLQVCKRKKKKRRNPGELFRSVGVTTFSLRLCLIFQLLLSSESPGFPLEKGFFLLKKEKKRKENEMFLLKTDRYQRWSNLNIVIKETKCIYGAFWGCFVHGATSILVNVESPESYSFDDKEKKNTDTTQEWNSSSKNRQEYLQVTLCKQNSNRGIFKILLDRRRRA